MGRDKNNQFKFAALQSAKGRELLEKFNLPKDDFDSFILISGDKIFIKSAAAFGIAKHLKGWPKLFLPFKYFPQSFADCIYDMVARNRYKFFGKKDACRIPTPEERSKFL